jgi:hypothetical protein
MKFCNFNCLFNTIFKWQGKEAKEHCKINYSNNWTTNGVKFEICTVHLTISKRMLKFQRVQILNYFETNFPIFSVRLLRARDVHGVRGSKLPRKRHLRSG